MRSWRRVGVYQGNDFKKITGGLKRPHRKNRKYEMGRFPVETRLGENDFRVIERVRGGNIKIRIKEAVYANVFDPKSKTSKKVKIKGIVSTPSNPDLARRGIIVKGSIIETEIGKAKVSSRPGQDGVINAVLID
jgi:small subunit ribosomal protein S8e